MANPAQQKVETFSPIVSVRLLGRPFDARDPRCQAQGQELTTTSRTTVPYSFAHKEITYPSFRFDRVITIAVIGSKQGSAMTA